MDNKKDLIYAGGLTAVVFIAHYFSDFLEKKVVAGEQLAWLWLFLWYTAFMFLGLKILNKVRL